MRGLQNQDGGSFRALVSASCAITHRQMDSARDSILPFCKRSFQITLLGQRSERIGASLNIPTWPVSAEARQGVGARVLNDVSAGGGKRRVERGNGAKKKREKGEGTGAKEHCPSSQSSLSIVHAVPLFYYTCLSPLSERLEHARTFAPSIISR